MTSLMHSNVAFYTVYRMDSTNHWQVFRLVELNGLPQYFGKLVKRFDLDESVQGTIPVQSGLT